MEFYSNFVSTPLDERQTQAFRLVKRFPERLPVIVDRANRNAPKLDRNKYIINAHDTLSQVIYLLRKRLKLNPQQAVFFFSDDNLLSGNMTISQIRHLSSLKHGDGFTYLFYSLEDTFG